MQKVAEGKLKLAQTASVQMIYFRNKTVSKAKGDCNLANFWFIQPMNFQFQLRFWNT